jgi:hypothetical protein
VRKRANREERDNFTFRRSRTLNGSVSDLVESSNTKRLDLESDRLKLHQLNRQRNFFKTILIVSVVLVVLCSFLVSRSLILADIVLPTEFSGAGKENKKLKKVFFGYINNYPTEALSFTLNEGRAANFLQQNGYPEIKSVAAKINWIGLSDKIKVEYRSPVAVWSINNKKYYVDREGAVFENYSGVQPKLQIKDTNNYISQLSEKETIASRQFIGYIGKLVGYIEKINAPEVREIEIPPISRQLNIYLKNRDYAVYVNTERSPLEQAIDIKKSTQVIDNKNLKPEYLDVRAEGEAFFK